MTQGHSQEPAATAAGSAGAAEDMPAADAAAEDMPAADGAPETVPDAGAADEVGAVVRQRDDYLEQLLRARAEFDNYRKRTNRERMEALDRGAAALVERMLGVLDNLSFAQEAAAKSDDEQLAKGVAMVHRELFDVLVSNGLEELGRIGETFDPQVHEAMVQVDATEPTEEPVIAEILRRGYRFKGRVLRPAAVTVAR